MRKMFRRLPVVLGVAALGLATAAPAQYGGAPPGAGAIRKPSGTTCRTVDTVVESRVDAACTDTGRRTVEIDERECTRLRDGHLEEVFTRLEERPQGCVSPEGETSS